MGSISFSFRLKRLTNEKRIIDMKQSTFVTVLSVLIMMSLIDAIPTKIQYGDLEHDSNDRLEILRDVRKTLRKTQAGIRLILSMERSLKRTARHIAEKINREEDIVMSRKNTKKTNDDIKRHPFQSWAG